MVPVCSSLFDPYSARCSTSTKSMVSTGQHRTVKSTSTTAETGRGTTIEPHAAGTSLYTWPGRAKKLRAAMPGMPAVAAHAPRAITHFARSRSWRTHASDSSVVTAPSITATSNSSGMGSLDASCQYRRSICPSTSVRYASAFVICSWQPKQLASPTTTTRGRTRSLRSSSTLRMFEPPIYIDPWMFFASQ